MKFLRTLFQCVREAYRQRRIEKLYEELDRINREIAYDIDFLSPTGDVSEAVIRAERGEPLWWVVKENPGVTDRELRLFRVDLESALARKREIATFLKGQGLTV